MADFVESARKELAAWLSSQLSGSFPTLKVYNRFPAPGKQLSLPALAIQVVGEPIVEPHATKWHAVSSIVGPSGIATLSYGRIELDMQLDVWGANAAARYSLTKAVSDAVNVHPIYSLPIVGALPEFRHYPGVVRYLTDFYNVVASYEFTEVANPVEMGDAAQVEEWRAVFVGSCRFYAVTQEQVAVLTQAILQTTLNGATETRTDP